MWSGPITFMTGCVTVYGLVLSGFPPKYLMEPKSGENRIKICLCEVMWFGRLQLVAMIFIVTCLEKVLNSHSSVFGEIGSRFISPEKDTPTSRYQSMDGLNM